MSRITLGLCLVLVAATCALSAHSALAQITRVGDTYRFRVKFVKGQKLNYIMTTTSKLKKTVSTPAAPLPPPMITTSPMSLNVLDVRGNLFTLEVTLGPFRRNGRTIAREQKAQMQVNDQNKPLKNTPGSPEVSAGLPPHPLKVGESYSIQQTVAHQGKSITVQATYIFKGVKTVGSVRAAELDSTMTLRGAVTTKETGATYLSLADGTLISSTTHNIATKMQGRQTLTLVTDSVITRR